MEEANLAVLIDFENIAAGTEKEGLGRFDVKALMARFKDKGRVLIARSYADWGRFSRFKQGLLTENVTMMELTSHGMQDKNRADIALVVDALELAFTRDYIDTYIIVSGDSDFTPMVLKMRELNKRVIGCGTRKSTSRLLIQACDEFVFYDSIVKPAASKKRRPKATKARGDKLTKETAWDLLMDAVEGLQRENPDPPLAGVVKQAMLRKSPDFSESDLGYGSFTRFLEGAQDADLVEISRDSKSGGYRVDGVDGNGEGEDEDDKPVSSGWVDEYIPQGVDMWLDALDEAGIHPLSKPVRMDVLEALTQVVTDRRKRRRKSTINFVAEDVKKQLRRTHPELPLKFIRGILEALRIAEQLIHRDGGPVRTASASFKLNKDAEGLNKALLNTYLATLKEAGVELVDSDALAALFLGDKERAREVEEALAWIATDGARAEEADLNDKNLDDLLLAGADDALTAEPKADEKKDEKKATTKSKAKTTKSKTTSKAKTKKADDEEKAADEDKAADDAKAEEAPKKKPRKRAPKKKTTTTKATTETAKEADAKADEPAADDAKADDAKAEEPKAEKPKTTTKRKRTRKKKEPEAEGESVPTDLDALLESSSK